MNLTSSHWTVRWYRHYVSLGGFGRDPENLCRFLRVILIWAPIRWLFFTNKKDTPAPFWIAAITVVLVGMSFIGIGGITLMARDIYVEKGMSGFVPPPWMGYVVGTVILAGIVAFVTSGLLALYRQKFKDAKAGGFCSFIELEDGEKSDPVGKFNFRITRVTT